jgi:hypothetical protein
LHRAEHRIELYLRGYRAQHMIDRDRLDRWLVVLAGVRLTYDIAGERDGLLAAIANAMMPAR